ncbi:MAG: hypothetical protein ACRDL5_14040 [Solirubrobacteraceae bacterium]
MAKTIRNIAIVFAVAAAIAILPGGGTAALLVGTAITLAFLGSAAWVASILYREHRDTIYLLGDGRRVIVYLALAVLAVTLTATSRLWHTPLGEIAWLVLIGVSVYAVAAVVWAARRQV